jgi:hypothetical protein
MSDRSGTAAFDPGEVAPRARSRWLARGLL